MRRLLLLLLLAVPTLLARDQQPVNWTGDFQPCDRRSELLKRGHMDLGVRVSTSNPVLAIEFRRAMRFWAAVVDMNWYLDNSSHCSIQLVDGTSSILKNAVVARSQFVEWSNFQGWIAFDPTAPLTREELYLTAVHEIGHLLGLKHNPNPNSVMFYLDLRGREVLDREDLAALSSRHTLRIASIRKPVRIGRPAL
jgi:Matrixin